MCCCVSGNVPKGVTTSGRGNSGRSKENSNEEKRKKMKEGTDRGGGISICEQDMERVWKR